MPARPWWPFGRAVLIPKPQRHQRRQCRACMGGGEVNGCPCPGGCEGRGWFDAEHPEPKENSQ